MSEIWTYCWICGRGIRESEPNNEFSVKSSLAAHPDYLDFKRPGDGYYHLKSHIDSSSSWFYFCKRCSGELETGLKGLLRRIEKKFGSKKRLTPPSGASARIN